MGLATAAAALGPVASDQDRETVQVLASEALRLSFDIVPSVYLHAPHDHASSSFFSSLARLRRRRQFLCITCAKPFRHVIRLRIRQHSCCSFPVIPDIVQTNLIVQCVQLL
jgi:hypothetical protein